MALRTQLLIAAAGLGRRLGSPDPKALIDLAGRPMIIHTLDRFRPLGLTESAVVLCPEGARPAFERVLRQAYAFAALTIIEGGAERQDSVAKGLTALRNDTEIVVIHDAARPFVAAETVGAAIEAAAQDGAATVAIPSADTILVADENSCLLDTPERQRLWACQTPQVFRVEVIREAHESAKVHGRLCTDDATLVQRAGKRVRLVMGTRLNFKVTTPADLALARLVAEGRLA